MMVAAELVLIVIAVPTGAEEKTVPTLPVPQSMVIDVVIV
jgi:hypothetical protein